MTTHQTLQQASVGDTVRVVGYARGERALRHRLLALGLTRGIEVHVARTAPAGCPFELQVRGMSIVLRRSEAAGLLVESIGARA